MRLLRSGCVAQFRCLADLAGRASSWLGRLVRRNAQRFPANVRFGDIVRGLPVETSSAEAAYASHVLEHLSLTDFEKALRETFRILKPGGVFRLIVPDLEVRARSYVAALDAGRSDANDAFMRSTTLGVERRNLLVDLGNARHLWMWDYPSMKAALERHGFVAVRRCALNDAADPMFLMVEQEWRFVHEGVVELAMEARKPEAPRLTPLS